MIDIYTSNSITVWYFCYCFVVFNLIRDVVFVVVLVISLKCNVLCFDVYGVYNSYKERCRSTADIVCSHPICLAMHTCQLHCTTIIQALTLDLLKFELKTGTSFTLAMGNVHINFVFSMTFCFQPRSLYRGSYSWQTDKIYNAACQLVGWSPNNN